MCGKCEEISLPFIILSAQLHFGHCLGANSIYGILSSEVADSKMFDFIPQLKCTWNLRAIEDPMWRNSTFFVKSKEW